MLKYLIFIIILSFIISCSDEITCPECVNVFLDNSADVLIVYIVDGDTFDFFEQNEKIQIRVLHIDCFETRRTARLKEQSEKAGITEDSALSLGFKAKDFADSLLMNKIVRIKRDSLESNFDVYGRLLRHVFIDGKDYAGLLRVNGLVVPE